MVEVEKSRDIKTHFLVKSTRIGRLEKRKVLRIG